VRFPPRGLPAAARPARPPKRAVWRAFQGIERGDAPSSCVKIEASPELAVMLKPKRKCYPAPECLATLHRQCMPQRGNLSCKT
jgi:hypothetical protein